MDNLRTHHVQAAGELLRDAGAKALSPPVYSPDLNPIEKLWSREFPEIMRKRKRGQGAQGKAEDEDGLTPVKDDNAALRFLDR